MESDRHRQLFIEKMLKKSQSSREETSITAMATMDAASPSLLRTDRAQRDHPTRGSTRSNAQAGEALWIGKRRLVQREAPTLLIRETCLNPQSCALQATSVLGCSPIRDQRAGR